MPTHYATQRENRIQQIGRKPDIKTRPKKSDVMAGLARKLQEAKDKLQKKIAENDAVAADKLRDIIKNLESTMERNK